MTSFSERLRNVYGNQEENQNSSVSWIPKRKYHKGDLLGEIGQNASKGSPTSEQNIQTILGDEFILSQCRDDIFLTIANFLLEEYGQDGYQTRLDHFQESWDKMLAKYGKDLIFALAEITDEITEIPFVNFAGYLDKEIVKNRVVSMQRRVKKLEHS